MTMLLSNRERQVLVLLAEGLTREEVANALSISPYTVREYAKNSMLKLGAHNIVNAIAIALRGRLIP